MAPQTIISALDAFFAGRMTFEKLEETLSAVARASPDAQRSTLAHLKELVDVGRLPIQLAHALAGKIGRAPAAPPPQDDAPGGTAPAPLRQSRAAPAPPAEPAAPFGEDATEPLPIPPRPPAARPRPAITDPGLPPAARPGADGTPALPDGEALRAKVEDVVLSALLSDFKSYRKADGPTAPRAKPVDRQLDSMLEPFKGARDRATARRGAGPGAKSFDLESATDGSTPTSQTAGVGTILKNRFVLDRLLGKGGMGEVFAAVDRRKLEALERHPYVAVKVLNDEFRRHPDALRALESEARRAQELAHPNIVNVFDFDRDGRVVFITMELLHGKPLDQLLRQSPGALPQPEALRIIDGVCRAVAHAHKQGVIHADLKPANIFVLDDGTVKVLDFGIAGAVERPADVNPAADKGEARRGGARRDGTRDAGGSFDPDSLGMLTRAYASPEMIEGLARDPRDDVFALGIIAYLLLSGRHPFDRRPATEARDRGQRPPAIARLDGGRRKAIDQALAYDRDKRTASVEAFRRALIEPGLLRRLFGGG